MQKALCAALHDSFPSQGPQKQVPPRAQGKDLGHNEMLREALGCLEARLQLISKDPSRDPFARHYRKLLSFYSPSKGKSAARGKGPSRAETVDLVETFKSIWAHPGVPAKADLSQSKQRSPPTNNRPLNGCEKEWLTKMYYVTLFMLDRPESVGRGPLVLAGLTFKHRLPNFGGDVRRQVLRAVDFHIAEEE